MTKNQQQELEQITQCEIVTKVKYLGIWITARNIDRFKNNYLLLWKNIEKDMENWRDMNFLFFGRIAAIKMNIPLRILYLYQNIPIFKELKVFDQWQKIKQI